MRITVSTDVRLDRETAFREVIRLEMIEDQLLRRGIDIARLDGDMTPGVGMGWTASLPFAGGPRAAECHITVWSPPEAAAWRAVSDGIVVEVVAGFSAQATTSTRLEVMVEISAQRLRDRMLLKGLNMTKARLADRLSNLVGGIARDAERRAGGA